MILFYLPQRLEMTARLAPKAVFKAFRAIYNEAEAWSLPPIYTYDEQNVTVNLEDRTLVRAFFVVFAH